MQTALLSHKSKLTWILLGNFCSLSNGDLNVAITDSQQRIVQVLLLPKVFN